MSRKLPVYLLVDCSGSMRGTPIQEAKKGVDSLFSALITHPALFEYTYLSVIAFANQATALTPLTPLWDFQTPDFPDIPEGGSFLGAALELLETQVRQEVQKKDDTHRGDFPVMTFILTDGKPSDTATYKRMARRIRSGELREIQPENIFVCATGLNAKPNALCELTNNALVLKNLTDSEIIDRICPFLNDAPIYPATREEG